MHLYRFRHQWTCPISIGIYHYTTHTLNGTFVYSFIQGYCAQSFILLPVLCWTDRLAGSQTCTEFWFLSLLGGHWCLAIHTEKITVVSVGQYLALGLLHCYSKNMIFDIICTSGSCSGSRHGTILQFWSCSGNVKSNSSVKRNNHGWRSTG